MKKNDQRSRTRFLEKYGGLSLYDIDMKKRNIIHHEDIHFGNPDNPDGTSIYQEYFIIHNNLFDRTLAMDHNNDIAFKIVLKDVLFSSVNESSVDSISKLKRWFETGLHHHQIQRKRQKTVIYYSKKSIDDIKFIVVYPSPKLTDPEKKTITDSYMPLYQ